jgi:hypothetical protein
MVARSLLTARVDTTVSGIGAAVYCLTRFPEQFERVRSDPGVCRPSFRAIVPSVGERKGDEIDMSFLITHFTT